MTEVVTIDNEELVILCDIVSGWGVKKWAENPGAAKKHALEPAHDATRYQTTIKTEILSE